MEKYDFARLLSHAEIGPVICDNAAVPLDAYTKAVMQASAAKSAYDALVQIEAAERAKLKLGVEQRLNPLLQKHGLSPVGTSDAELSEFATGIVSHLFEKRQR